MERSGDDAMARYRTIAEPLILEFLMVQGWRQECIRGEFAESRQSAAAALDALVAAGLPFRDVGDGERLFDPVEVYTFTRQAGLNGANDFWATRCVPTGRAMVWDGRIGGGDFSLPPSPIDLGPRRYQVKLSRTYNTRALPSSGRARLRLPLPIEDAALTDLSVVIEPSIGVTASFHQAVGYLDARLDLPAPDEVTVSADLRFTARGVGPTEGTVRQLNEADAALYLRSAEGLIHVSPRISALARTIADGETRPSRLALLFWRYVQDGFVVSGKHYDSVDPHKPLDDVLDQRIYNCQFGSALMVSLCRAVGIPARLVTGYLLYAGPGGFHTWLEVWLEETGWTPFDLASWDLSLGGTDPLWRDCFAGQVDHRMVVERPPRLFSGPGSIRLPKAWHLLVAIEGGGTRYAFHDLATGDLVYSEYVEVIRLD